LRPPRLLYVVSLFPCWSETFIVREIAALIAAGADVRILSLKPPSEKLVHPEAERLLPRVRHPLSPGPAALRRAAALLAHPRALSSLALALGRALAWHPIELAKSLEAVARAVEQLAWVREFDPDVIHAHWASYPSTAALALGRLLGKPFGFTCHAHDIFVHDHLLREKIESAAVPVTISRYNVDWLAEQVTARARERLTVIHCGVDLPTLPFQQDEGREQDLIVTVGRLDPIKGFDILIDALAELKGRGRRFRCQIIGEGPLRSELQTRIDRQGLSRLVELVGARPQSEVRAALCAATVFTLPSLIAPSGDRDGIPVSLMEAMAAGAPVVSTRVSGIPELIEDEREGLLVAPQDSPALAEALARLLDDAALRRRLAVAARAKIEREFDAAREANKLLELFAHARARA
jgi:colanic acid/amylovoran biosynthesis glycosyltransferase